MNIQIHTYNSSYTQIVYSMEPCLQTYTRRRHFFASRKPGERRAVNQLRIRHLSKKRYSYKQKTQMNKIYYRSRHSPNFITPMHSLRNNPNGLMKLSKEDDLVDVVGKALEIDSNELSESNILSDWSNKVSLHLFLADNSLPSTS